MKTLERTLGLTPVVAISMAGMLGSGLFVLPGVASAMTGPSMWLAYLVAGLCVLPAALSTAELATAMPESGGTYVYLERAYGPLAGTVGGLGLWMSLLLKAAFALMGLTWYLQEVIHGLDNTVAAVVILVAIMVLNMVGVRKVGEAQIAMVVLSVLGLFVLVGIGAARFDGTLMEPAYTNGAFGFIETVAVVYIGYAGVTKVAAIAEEVKNPGRTLPVGMLASVLIVGVLYGVVNYIMAGNISAHLHTDAGGLQDDFHPMYTLARTLGGSGLAFVFAILGTLTMVSMANAGMLAASRFPFAMSRDKLLPPVLQRVNQRYLTPIPAILVTSLLMGCAILYDDLPAVAKLASAFKIIMFMAVCIAVVVLRESHAQWYRPVYRAPFYPWIQVAGVLLGIVLLAMMGWLSVIALVAVGVPGVLLHLGYGRRLEDRVGVLGRMVRRQAVLDEPPSTSQAVGVNLEDALPESAAVAVTLFGHERSPETLVGVATAIADGAKVEVVHLTGVPEQMNLEDMLEDGPVVTSLRRRIGSLAQEREVDLTFNSVVTRDVVKTVHHVTSRVHCEWLVMEWRGRTALGVLQTNPIGWLVDHLPCHMALFKDAGIRSISEILVLAEPGPNDALVVETADHLADVYGARVTFARYVPVTASPMKLQAESDYVDQLAQMCPSPHAAHVLQGTDFVATVLEATAAHDLLVMGVPHDEGVISTLLGTPKDRITRKAACSVLKLKMGLEMEVVGDDDARPSASLSAWLRRPVRVGSFRLSNHVDANCVRVGMVVAHQRELFAVIAETFAAAVPGVGAEEIEDALWEREATQGTNIGNGVAMPHATLLSADKEYLGVFVLSHPVFFDVEGDDAVDICFVTLDPPSERKQHPQLLADMERVLAASDVLERLRGAADIDEVLEICAAAELKR